MAAIAQLDRRALALMRIALGTLLLLDTLQRSSWIEAHLTNAGLVPRDALLRLADNAPSPLCLHLLSGEATLQTVLLLLGGAAAIALTLGVRTRWATALCWLFWLGLHERAPLVLHRGDDLLRLVLFWSIFLPLGARYSIDAVRAGRGEEPAHEAVTGIAPLALLLQLASVYIGSVFYKDHPIWTLDHSAVHYALSLDSYTRPWARVLLDAPSLLQALTVGTLLLEAFVPLLLFVPWARDRLRLVAFALFWAFHLGLLATMQLGLFPWMAMAAWLAVLPGSAMDRLEARLPRPPLPQGWVRFGADTPPARIRPPLNVLIGGLAAYGLLLNVHALRMFQHEALGREPRAPLLPPAALEPGRWLGLQQEWSMFAPHPAIGDGWLLVVGRLDGREWDLERDAPVDYRRPASFSTPLRWRQLTSRIHDEWDLDLATRYAAYHCQSWSRAHPDRPAREVSLIFADDATPEPPARSELNYVVMLSQGCAGDRAHP